MTVHIHIGLHKTGTSSLQAFLKTNRDGLAARGFAIPQAGWVQGGHHNIGYELLGKGRFEPARGDLAALVGELDSAPNLIVTSEEFEFLDVAGVRRLREAIGERPARIILNLRRQDALIASTFAQQVKMGAKLGPFSDYVLTSLYDPRFDFSQLVNRWAGLFGREALSVGVVCEETAGPRLFEDFAARVGFDLEGLRHGKALNTSPSWSEIELLRRVVGKLKRQRERLDTPEVNALRAACYARVAETKALHSGRIMLSPGEYERVKGRFEHGNRKVAAEFVNSAAQAAALAFTPYEGEMTRLPPQKLMAENVDAVLAEWSSGALTSPLDTAKPEAKRKRAEAS